MSEPSTLASAPPPDRFRLLVEAVQDYGIFMLDPQGHVMSWNLGAQRLKGYEASEIIGQLLQHELASVPAGRDKYRKVLEAAHLHAEYLMLADRSAAH